MSKIFISYSRVDTAFVERFIKRLRLAYPRFSIWYDQSTEGLIGGDDWWESILKGIAESDLFIYILSNESVQSEYCQAEFTEARRLQKRIITIQARDKTRLTEPLASIQLIDMKNGADDPEGFDRVVAAINSQSLPTKKRRAKWQPATPKPGKETPPARTADAPEVETPPLKVPAPEQEVSQDISKERNSQVVSVSSSVDVPSLRQPLERKPPEETPPVPTPIPVIPSQVAYAAEIPERKQGRDPLTMLQIVIAVATLVVTLIAAFVGIAPWLIERTENGNATQTALAVAAQNTPAPSDTVIAPTATLTETPTSTNIATSNPTVDIAASRTVIAEYIAQTALFNDIATEAQKTLSARQTELYHSGETATAALWTPTPSMTFTLTSTPTNTATPIPTFTLTPEPTFTPTVTPTLDLSVTTVELIEGNGRVFVEVVDGEEYLEFQTKLCNTAAFEVEGVEELTDYPGFENWLTSTACADFDAEAPVYSWYAGALYCRWFAAREKLAWGRLPYYPEWQTHVEANLLEISSNEAQFEWLEESEMPSENSYPLVQLSNPPALSRAVGDVPFRDRNGLFRCVFG
jgi:hypothetical protein